MIFHPALRIRRQGTSHHGPRESCAIDQVYGIDELVAVVTAAITGAITTAIATAIAAAITAAVAAAAPTAAIDTARRRNIDLAAGRRSDLAAAVAPAKCFGLGRNGGGSECESYRGHDDCPA
jgi:hypothetical protein